MASIEKRGNSYRIKVSCGYKADGTQAIQRMTWTPDPSMTEKQIEKEVQRQAVLFEEDCKRGQVVSAVKFETFANEWFEDYAKLNLKSTAYTRQKQLTKRTYKAIGHIRLDRLTTREIQKFINSLAKDGVNEKTGKPLSRKTMVHYLSFISTIMDYAIKMDMLTDNPCRRVTIPKGSKKERKIYTIEQTEKFIKLLEEAPLKWQMFFMLDIYSGMRRGEMLGLEWKDIDLVTGVIHIQRTSNYQSGYEPAFVLNYVGRTQSRKSTLAALILSFFGKFNASCLPANFKDTANALEKKGFILKDMLMIVDDFHPASTINERKNMEQNMQALSRMYGDRRARSRLNYDITLRSGNVPRGNVAVTGEDVASIGQSGIARNFIVEIKPDDIPVSDELNAAQKYAADGYLSEFMRGYIEWLIPQVEKLPEKLKNIFLSYRQRAIDEQLSGFGRTGDIIAWLMTGVELLSDFLTFRNIISADEKYPDQIWEIFKKLAALQLDKSEETTPTAMFVESVRQLMECGKIYAENIGGRSNCSGSKVGYCDTEFYYFIPDMIYGEVSRSSSSNGTAFPLSSRRIYKQLAAENITITNDGKNTFQKRIGSRRGRYLCIPRGIIDDAA